MVPQDSPQDTPLWRTPLSRRTFGAGIAAAAAATLIGCGDDKKGPSNSSTPDKVTYLTGFGLFGRESYVHVAQAKGFFREVGIEVDIQPGAAGDANIKLLTAGQAQFAAVDASGEFIRIGKGTDTATKIVAAVNQRTIIGLGTLDDTGITRPTDLKGKKLGVATGAVPKTLFPAYARLAGIDTTGITWVDSTPQLLNGLMVGHQVDAIGLFVVATPALEAAAKGKKVVLFPYGDYMADLYGNVIITTRTMLDTKPDLVKRFTGALMKGVDYAVNNPDEAGNILHSAVPAQVAVVAGKELTIMKPYSVTSPGTPIGLLDPVRVARSIALLASLGLMPPDLTPEKAVDFSIIGKA